MSSAFELIELLARLHYMKRPSHVPTYPTSHKNSAFGGCVFVPIVLYLGSSQVKKEIAHGIKRFLFARTECSA